VTVDGAVAEIVTNPFTVNKTTTTTQKQNRRSASLKRILVQLYGSSLLTVKTLTGMWRLQNRYNPFTVNKTTTTTTTTTTSKRKRVFDGFTE
jgi:hypothetical protein